MGGVANGEGKQESMGVGENACVFSEEDGEEIPSQVSNTDNELLFISSPFLGTLHQQSELDWCRFYS